MIWAKLDDIGSTTCDGYKRCDEGRWLLGFRPFPFIGQFSVRIFTIGLR